MAFVHHRILGVDVGDRQLHDAKQGGGGRVFLRPRFVGDDVHGVHREAIVGAVGQFGVDVFLLARQGGERHLQPDDVLARLQHVANPVRRPGIVEHRFTFFIPGNGVGHHRRVVALVMGDGFAQAIGVNLMVNHCFAAPSWGTAGEIRFTVIVGIKQFGDLRIFELIDGGDVVLLSGFFVDQIALGGA